MHLTHMITAVDAHAAGEPGRVITGGVLDVPGATMFEKMKYLEQHGDELRQRMVDGTPLRRLGEVDDIAAAALYLASPAASYVTGRILEVDGGLQRSNLDMGLADLG